MGGDRDSCGNEGMQRETRLAASTGTRGGGWGDRSFLHRNAGKKTTIEVKHGNLRRDLKASCLPLETQSTENMKDLAQIPRCAHYVCSENRSINNTLLIKTKMVGVRGGVAVRHHFNFQVRLVNHDLSLNRLFSRYFEYSELIFIISRNGSTLSLA